jgi:hypothetical protein
MNTLGTRRIRCAGLAIALPLFASTAFAQELSLKSSDSVDFHPVFWVKDCRSLLTSFAGVDVLEGPSGVTVAIREEEVIPQRQGCSNKVRGGIVVASVRELPVQTSGILRYRVRYNTPDGLKQSNHSVQLVVQP